MRMAIRSLCPSWSISRYDNIDLNPDLPSALVGAKSDPMRVVCL